MIIHVDRNCFRGPRPRSLAELLGYKINTIIDLESGVYELLNGVYQQFPSDYGMAPYHMPCSDIFPPTDSYVEKAIELMSNSGRKTYIHCLSGVDRTGYVCAAYRVRIQNWPVGDAVSEWKNLGRHSIYFWWEKSLRRFVRSV